MEYPKTASEVSRRRLAQSLQQQGYRSRVGANLRTTWQWWMCGGLMSDAEEVGYIAAVPVQTGK